VGGAWTLGSWLSGNERKIHDKLQERLPHLTVKAVLPTPAQGVYAVETENEEAKKTLHATADGSYVIAGDLYEITKEGAVNLTETRREEQRRELLKQVEKKDTITYSSEGDPQAVLYVFTDVDCGYCRAFHNEVGELNRLGIEVRYLAFPRAGAGSRTWERMVSAWCAEDRHAVLTKLKLGEDVAMANCENPVAEQYRLARAFDVEGTPTSITARGKKIHGFAPATELVKMLGMQ